MDKTTDIVIIGGGIIGASIAFHLAQKGAGKVVVLEKDMVGDGTTAKCAGGIRVQFSTEINIRFSLESYKTWDRFHEIMDAELDFRKTPELSERHALSGGVMRLRHPPADRLSETASDCSLSSNCLRTLVT